MNEGQSFCGICGTKVKTSSKAPVIIVIVVVIIALLTTGGFFVYKALVQKPEQGIEAMRQALLEGNAEYIKEHLGYTTGELISDEALKSYVDYVLEDGNAVEKVDYVIRDMEKNYDSAERMGNIISKEYFYRVSPCYITVSSNFENTKYILDGSYYGKTEEKEESLKVGPLLPRTYKITAKNSKWEKSLTKEADFMKQEEQNKTMKFKGEKKAVKKKTTTSRNSGSASVSTPPSSGSISAPKSGGGYMLADSAYKVYSSSSLSSWDVESLCIARNEIYARHGYTFDSSTWVGQALQDYFDAMSWYSPNYSINKNNPPSLSSVEQSNVQTMLTIERAKGSPYI